MNNLGGAVIFPTALEDTPFYFVLLLEKPAARLVIVVLESCLFSLAAGGFFSLSVMCSG